MSDRTFEIVRAAVNLARFEQIRRVGTLRARLAARYPDSEREIGEALSFWAAQVSRQ